MRHRLWIGLRMGLLKNATRHSHLPTEKMLRTVELQVLGVSPGRAGLLAQNRSCGQQ